MKLSIIIPCYNIENFIEKCIESLIKQNDDKNVEIILINDGSIDNTEKKIKKYIEKVKNIKYFSKKNEGLSKTRNFGIEKAKGKYIMFLDGDDYLESQFMDTIFPLLERDIDLINIPHRQVILDKKNEIKKVLKNYYIDKKKLNLKDYIFNSFLTSACTKVIKKEILDNNKIIFSEKKWYEDVNFVLKVVSKSKEIQNVDIILYNYVQRETSITRTYTEKILDIFYIIDDILEFFEKNRIPIKKNEKDYLVFEYCLNHNYSRIVRVKEDIKKIVLLETIKHLKEKNIKNNFLKYLEIDLKYLDGIAGRVYFKILSFLKKGF